MVNLANTGPEPTLTVGERGVRGVPYSRDARIRWCDGALRLPQTADQAIIMPLVIYRRDEMNAQEQCFR